MIRAINSLRGPLWAAGLALVLSATAHAAVDKSGVKPNTVSLPSGPGSIEGLGESFQPTLNTGTAKYAIGLSVPPGTAGHAPDLALRYEGGQGNGPLGYGWTLDIPYIRRQSEKGIPLYVDADNLVDDDGDGIIDDKDEIDIFVNDMGEELVPQPNGDYFCENEGAFIRYRKNASGWEATLPDGTRMYFGLNANARIKDTSRIYSWLIESIVDTHGNTISFSYENVAGNNDTRQKYLSFIKYGPGAPPWNNFHYIKFTYESRQDWFEDARSGFTIRTGSRLKEILVASRAPAETGHARGDYDNDGSDDNLVRIYRLAYTTHPHWSLLSSVTPVGADGLSMLPPSTFTYTVCNPAATISASNTIVGGQNEPIYVPGNPLVDFLDVNGDALPDLLKTDQFGGPHKAYLNKGTVQVSGNPVVNWASPADVTSADGLAWSVNLQSTDKVAHLADMDGDGISDLVFKSTDMDVYWFRNTGAKSWGQRKKFSKQDSAPPSPFGTPGVKNADLDNDKRIDVIQSISNGNAFSYRVWINLGGQKFARSQTYSPPLGFDLALPGVDIADVNGDRVPDIARIQPTSVTVTPGLGFGKFGAAITVPIPGYTLTTEQVNAAKLMDITGDGMVDLVIERAAPGELWYWINLGTYTLDARRTITGMPTGIGTNTAIRWADMNGNGTTDLVYCDGERLPRLQTVDVGQLLGCVPSPNLLTKIENGIGRVTHVEYTTSAILAAADAAVNAPWPDPLPFPVHVVARVRNQDSLGHEYVSEFAYHDGYYDGTEKVFRGFARVEVREIGDATAPTLVTRHYFDTGKTTEPMKGKLLRQTALDEANQSFWDETTTYTTRELYAGTPANENKPVRFALPVKSVRDILERGQGTPKKLETEFDFDDYGNQTESKEWGIVDGTNKLAGNDERITETTYALNTANWMLRYPARTELKDGSGALLSKSETYYDDPSFGGANFGVVTLGDVTLVKSWVNPATSSATVDSARTQYDAYGNPVALLDPLAVAPGGGIGDGAGHYRSLTYDNKFHAFPVLETIHVGGGKVDLEFAAAYDTAFGTVTSSTDFNGNTTSYGYDTFGRFVEAVRPGDSAGYPGIEYSYALAQPFGAGKVVNYVETRTLDKAPGSAGAVKRDHYLIARAFVDGMGRALLAKSEAEPEGGNARVSVSGAVLFNARSQPERALNPFYSMLAGPGLDALLAFEDITAAGWQGSFHENGVQVAKDLAAAHQSSTVYDALMRPVSVTNPDGTHAETVYEPLLTKSYDENDTDGASPHANTPMAHYLDGLERLVRVDEVTRLNDNGTPSAGLNTWSTFYQYRADDLLTRITDSQNNQKWMDYDGLGRKTFMNDMDRGVMHYAYDAASNLVQTTDAKGQVIDYAYDGVNRLLTEDYQDANNLTPDVAYHYDDAVANLDYGNNSQGTANNTKGYLAWVQDLTGEEHTSYDARGNVTWVVKRIKDTYNGVLTSYKTSMAYDPMNRVTALTYPDEDQCVYQYNDRGAVERITGGSLHNIGGTAYILTGLDYTPSGQQRTIGYGNGVTTEYRYDARARLTKLHTARDNDPANPLISYAYQFDNASNITKIDDLRPASVHAEGDPLRNTQSFTYDDLYRLTSVKYSFNLPGNPLRDDGTIDYRYDRIGNMLAQTSDIAHEENGMSVTNLGAMNYGGNGGASGRIGRGAADPPGPHALTNANNSTQGGDDVRNYPYDANGNMTDIDGMTCTWDYKDRLVAVENATMRAEYQYDYTDRRIWKKVWNKHNGVAPTVPSLTTSYIGKHFEVREGDQPTKYVFNGETRVARIVGTLDATKQRLQRIRLTQGWNLIAVCVNAPDAAAQLGLTSNAAVQAAWYWNPATESYEAFSQSTPLVPGSIVWVKATQAAVLEVMGNYTEPGDTVTATDHLKLFSPAALMALKPELAFANTAGKVWGYANEQQMWQAYTGMPALDLPDMDEAIQAAQAFAVKGVDVVEVALAKLIERIEYLHGDHLDSTEVLANAAGSAIRHERILPYGTARTTHDAVQPIQFSKYSFTGKERDDETQLSYFEARYLNTTIGCFSSVDPLLTNQPRLDWPADLNAYCYARNNPICMIDKNGLYAGIDDAIAIGVGAVIGGGAYALGQWIKGEQITVGGVLGHAAVGALAAEATLYAPVLIAGGAVAVAGTGLVSAATATTALTVAATVGIGTVKKLADDMVDGKQLSFSDAVTSGVVDFIGGKVAKGVVGVLQKTRLGSSILGNLGKLGKALARAEKVAAKAEVEAAKATSKELRRGVPISEKVWKGNKYFRRNAAEYARWNAEYKSFAANNAWNEYVTKKAGNEFLEKSIKKATTESTKGGIKAATDD